MCAQVGNRRWTWLTLLCLLLTLLHPRHSVLADPEQMEEELTKRPATSPPAVEQKPEERFSTLASVGLGKDVDVKVDSLLKLILRNAIPASKRGLVFSRLRI
uniref:Endoplasmin n=1 Tax=Macrostomum lignano TaxID=282301 RepID=A0A1I8GHD1_9PLAT